MYDNLETSHALTGVSTRQAEQSRTNAYAAMRRGESVQLSKDAINQLDQSSLTQREDLRQEYPRQDTAEAPFDNTPSDDEDDGFEVYYPPSDSTATKSGKQSSKMGKGKKTSGTNAVELHCVQATCSQGTYQYRLMGACGVCV